MRYKKDVYTNLALITQLGIHMMTPIFVCVAAGVLIDRYFGTSSTVILLILGILAGGRNTYILAMKAAGGKKKSKRSDYISQEYEKKEGQNDKE